MAPTKQVLYEKREKIQLVTPTLILINEDTNKEKDPVYVRHNI